MTESKQTNSKVLAKNTLFLYIRMILMMLVALYTSRVILQYLGVEDYGIYNAVGGIVAMFGVISASLSTSISRNLTFELGKGDMEKLKKIFSMSLNIQLILIAIIFLFGETIAVWFLNVKMVIPETRLVAANWILQLSLITFAINLFSVPYNASIIAHERMNVFAYIGIIEVVLKLLVVYCLIASPIDRLIFYGSLLTFVAIVIQTIYFIFCKRHFEECSYHFIKDKSIFKELFGFATWNFIGSASSIFRSQGVNIILNLFFGPVVNAARAISMQVNNAINGFVGNFMTALTPQITKAYAQGNYTYLLQCIYRGSKFSYYLLYFLSLPVFIETDYILRLWLVNVPESTVGFVRYILLFSLVDTYSRALINANNATGDIKVYQIVIGSLNLTVLPIAYFALKMGASAESTVLVSVFVSLVGLYPRIYFNKKHFPVSYIDFTTKVIFPTVIVSVAGLIIPYIVFLLLPDTFGAFAVVTILCFVSAASVIIILGCTKEERGYVISFIRKKIHKQL
ncbi:lipopolysaccharide biosynthesis protein [Bacteroides ovatus]|jgi:O-antigen/teichoic acid export membrane protein|uniref:lipopolysaccharide biosynthesis protein n=1 Tax=Bacteroides ovatus TaxID=28116 RepID=UPI002165D0FA|nr:lipopolysaccharide biosynthesis protein [Bacteroides ovatus]MCS2640798.1 lipopolysaccharide biosynthesis protein [Bacteroides ovatus]